MAMFIVDKLMRPKGIMQDNYIKLLKAKEDVAFEKYLYVVEKISLSILFIFITSVVSAVLFFLEPDNRQYLSKVNRDSQYSITVEDNSGKKENIFIDVPAAQQTKKEKLKKIEDVKKKLRKEILGQNTSTDYICYPINLVNSINDVTISWTISDETVIDYQGNIGVAVSNQGVLVELKAFLMVDDIFEEENINIVVYPSKSKTKIGEYLQKYVNENYTAQDSVLLPDSIDGKEISYFIENNNYSGPICLAGIILAIVVYFLKDKDLKKQLKVRDMQLLKDYSEIVSLILLYYGAGLPIRKTFSQLVKKYERDKEKTPGLFRYAYEEMSIALNKMNTGISEYKAIGDYGKRCGLHCYIKLSNNIQQNIKRGTKEITYALREELTVASNEKKNACLKEGNEISTKMLGPMLVMLIVAIIIVIFPAFMTMNL